jgi:hypothetical protein
MRLRDLKADASDRTASLSEVLDFLFSGVRISLVVDSQLFLNYSNNVTRWIQE